MWSLNNRGGLLIEVVAWAGLTVYPTCGYCPDKFL